MNYDDWKSTNPHDADYDPRNDDADAAAEDGGGLCPLCGLPLNESGGCEYDIEPDHQTDEEPTIFELATDNAINPALLERHERLHKIYGPAETPEARAAKRRAILDEYWYHLRGRR